MDGIYWEENEARMDAALPPNWQETAALVKRLRRVAKAVDGAALLSDRRFRDNWPHTWEELRQALRQLRDGDLGE